MPSARSLPLGRILAVLLFLASMSPAHGGGFFRNLFGKLDLSIEKSLGASTTEAVKKEKGVYVNPEADAWARGIFNRIIAHKQRNLNYSMTILDTPEVNAFAVPGGDLFVTKGLLAWVDSDDELACVIGHELTHVERKHSMKGLKNDLLFQAAAQLAAKKMDNDKIALGGQVVGMLQSTKFSRKHEEEADRGGMALAAKAGYDPSGMMSFMQKLNEGVKADRDFLNRILATHPPASSRIANAQGILKDMGRSFHRTDQLSYRAFKDNPPDWVKAKGDASSTATAATPPASTAPPTATPSSPVPAPVPATPVLPPPEVAQNLLPNPSFEFVQANTRLPGGWEVKGQGFVEVYDHQPADGRQALRFYTRAVRDMPNVVSSSIAIDPARPYRLEGAFRSTDSKAYVYFGLRYYDAGGKLLKYDYPGAQGKVPGKDWVVFGGEIGPGTAKAWPEGTRSVQIVLYGSYFSVATTWADRLAFGLWTGSRSASR